MAKQIIVQGDEFGEGWTKQNENNTEVYARVIDNDTISLYDATGAPSTNDYRIRTSGVILYFDRFDGADWINQLQAGGSITVPDGVTITKGNYSGEILIRDDVGTVGVVSVDPLSRALYYSDFNGNPTLTGTDDVYKGTKTRDNLQADIQPGNAYDVTGKEFITEAFTTFVDISTGATFFQTNFLVLQPVGIPVDNKVRLRVFESPNFDEGDQRWENVSLDDFNVGDGDTIVETLGDLQDSGNLTVDTYYEIIATTVDYFGAGLVIGDKFTATSALALSSSNSVKAITGVVEISPPFKGVGDKTLKISVSSLTDITLKSNDATGTDITISSIDEEGRQDSIAAYPFWQADFDYVIGDILFQNRTFYMANVPGAQITDFDTNIDKWDQPLSKEEMYRARMSAYLSTNLVLDGTEQLLAFDTVKWSRDIACAVGVFTIATKGYYSGDVNLRIDITGTSELFVFVEHKPFGGSWQLYDGATGFMFELSGFAQDFTGTVPLNGGFDLGVGDQIRFVIKRKAGLATLASTSEVVNLGTVFQPSVSITVRRTDNIIPV